MFLCEVYDIRLHRGLVWLSDITGANKSVSARASSQEPRRAVHANLPSAASSIPLRKLSKLFITP